MADDNKDDDKHGTGTGSTTSPSKPRKGEEPGAQNNFGGGQQDKAAKTGNFNRSDDEQDTHK